jgi:hypothetical protein
MIKRADASKISREKATKEQIAENFKRLAIDTDKKVELKPSLLKIQKTLDGNTFGIIHENKTYYLKYTTKKGSTNPTDYKHLDGLNATFGIEKFNSFDKATNKMNFICEAQNNAHKLRLLVEKEENIIDNADTSSDEVKSEKKPVTSDSTEDSLLKSLDKSKAPAADMGSVEPAGDMGSVEPAGDMGSVEPAAPEGGEAAPPLDTQPKGETPAQMADEILPAIGDDGSAPAGDIDAAPEGGEETPAEEPAAPEGGEETPAEEPAAPEEEVDPKKEFQETVGKLGQVINDLQDKKSLDKKDIKNVMNSVITAIGDDFQQLSDKEKEGFYQKIKGSSVGDEEPAAEETPVEQPAAEEDGTEKLDENFLKELKLESKKLLKEQLQQEIQKRKRKILIESIKRKLV